MERLPVDAAAAGWVAYGGRVAVVTAYPSSFESDEWSLATDEERAVLGPALGDAEAFAAFDRWGRALNAAVMAIDAAAVALGDVARAAGLTLEETQALAGDLSVLLVGLAGTADVGVLGDGEAP